MDNQNGNFILYLLDKFNKPISKENIAYLIATSLGTSFCRVFDTVDATIKAGVKYGFINKWENLYYISYNMDGTPKAVWVTKFPKHRKKRKKKKCKVKRNLIIVNTAKIKNGRKSRIRTRHNALINLQTKAKMVICDNVTSQTKLLKKTTLKSKNLPKKCVDEDKNSEKIIEDKSKQVSKPKLNYTTTGGTASELKLEMDRKERLDRNTRLNAIIVNTELSLNRQKYFQNVTSTYAFHPTLGWDQFYDDELLNFKYANI